MNKAVFFTLFISLNAFASTELIYDSGIKSYSKKVTFSKVECLLERSTDGSPRYHVYAGQFQRDVEERFELLINHANEIKKGENQISLKNNDGEGTSCLVTYDERRYVPHQTFCLHAKQNDYCDVKFDLDGKSAKISMKCFNLGRAIKPNSEERINFEIPSTSPIECEFVERNLGTPAGVPFAKE